MVGLYTSNERDRFSTFEKYRSVVVASFLTLNIEILSGLRALEGFELVRSNASDGFCLAFSSSNCFSFGLFYINGFSFIQKNSSTFIVFVNCMQLNSTSVEFLLQLQSDKVYCIPG